MNTESIIKPRSIALIPFVTALLIVNAIYMKYAAHGLDAVHMFMDRSADLPRFTVDDHVRFISHLNTSVAISAGLTLLLIVLITMNRLAPKWAVVLLSILWIALVLPPPTMS
jgi:hypothetical protein